MCCLFWPALISLADEGIHNIVLDPTPGTTNKGERMKRYYRTLTQIEENITKVVRLKHPNYKVKHWYHCITDNVPSCSR
jgi:hypothetical protein